MGDGAALRRNFIWNTVGSITYFACQWLFSILVVRLSGTAAGVANSGVLTTATTVTNVFLSIASYGMYNFQVSDASEKYAQSAYVRSRVTTCLLAVGLCCIFVYASNAFGPSPYDWQQVTCIFLMLMFRLVESVTDVYNAIEQKGGRLDLVGKTYAWRGLLSLVVFAVTLYLSGSIVLTLFLMVLGNLIFFRFYTKQKIKPFYEKTQTERRTILMLLWECMPLAVYSFLSTAAASIPKIVLERSMGNDALGIYGPVTAPVLLLQVGAAYLFTPFITVFADRYAQRDEKGFYKAVFQVQGIVVALLPVGLLVARYLGHWGLATFVSASLAQYDYLLLPMVFSAILTASVLFFSMVLTVMRCMKGLIFANLCGIITAACISLPFIRRWELQGTTYAAVAALCVQLICLVVLMLRQARKHFLTGGLQNAK